MSVSYVEPNKRLAGTRDACHEADDLLTESPRIFNNLVNCFRGSSKVLRPGVASGNRLHRMARIQRARRFDDRGRGQIAATLPV